MNDEPTERDVEALLARARRPMSGQCVICGGTQTVWNLDDHLSCAIDLIEEYAERIAQARREGAAEALKKIASDPEVIKKVKWRIDHYGPLDAEPFQFSRYESVAHAALSVLGDRVDALRGDA